MTQSSTITAPLAEGARWRDPGLAAAERVEALLAALTLEEKVGQLGSRWLGREAQEEPDGELGLEPEAVGDASPGDPSQNVAPMQDTFSTGPSLADAARHGLGHLTRIYGSAPVTPEEGARDLVQQQRVVLERSRLGIPAVVHEECLTGFTALGATVYPSALAWGATFDPDLVQEMADAIGTDMAALGVHHGLSPVLDVVRDYRWGRVEETLGEDPYLVALLGSAYVRGLQGAGVVATLKHFAGYSASRGARNHGPVPMGRRELADVVLPPFEAALRAGAASVMNSYSDVDGVPAAMDRWLLTDLLRGEWGFDGTVVSDYWAVPFLATAHRVAVDAEEAGVLALEAGIDVELPDTAGFGQHLVDRVRRGELDEALVDTAVRRVLAQKVAMGLLDEGWTPEGAVERAAGYDLDSAANRAIARRLAEESVVLLDAGTALPLLGDGRPALRRLAVVGPCADDARTLMGCYSFPNHVLPQYPGLDLGTGVAVPTALEALRAELGDVEVTHALGCEVLGDDRSGFEAAVAAAREADVCVALVGDLAGLFGRGTSGEGCDAPDLRLPGLQGELLEALLATGTPVVVVVVSGRPYALGAYADRAAALVQAFMPGEEGGAAVAGVLSGRVVPSGRLPVQVPRDPGGQPGTYLQPVLGVADVGASNLDPTPLFPFGHGRSYTTFALEDARLSSAEVPTDGAFSASVRVRNTGARRGTEVVQLYLHDRVGSVTRPVRQLAGFARVDLEPGESAEVVFGLHADLTSFTGVDLRRRVEPGDVEVQIGTSAGDLPHRLPVRLTGSVRLVGHDRQLASTVEQHRTEGDGHRQG
ncbi:glycoside hydrolase family 3 N-terminal domain-containing protein [Microlunatus flavus]|uniref:Exo-alpha-(1->6)-L-arabinopyranosidase n=1 Tax=Microlunatus flavus TaxID=1036181 RepID=A0A1H9GWX6_9ACTN|nr:glycoside hydrolase family 3 N-terminal domain-containing protein [Microlunatus flavus]SEQ54626.1 beta-glucosidase [Microlunatus flavus]